MSREARNLLVKLLFFLFVLCLTVGIIGAVAHKLDLSSTLMLAGTFIVGSLLLTWLTIWEDRRTRKLLSSIAADLAPHGLEVSASKEEYTILSQGALFDEVVYEASDLSELEAFVAGLRHGLLLAEAGGHDDGTMEARIATQEAQYIEDRAHIGVDSSHIWHIPGLEE